MSQAIGFTSRLSSEESTAFENQRQDALKLLKTGQAPVGVKLLRDLAEKRYPPAQFSLGCCLEDGDGTEINLKEAFFWYQQAAPQFIPAQVAKGICLLTAKGCEKDVEEGHEVLKWAARFGDAQAQYNLAQALFDEETIQNFEEGVEWYRKAAIKGHAGAQHNLACCLRDGVGTVKDEKEANQWFQKAAGQGYGKSNSAKHSEAKAAPGATQSEASAALALGVVQAPVNLTLPSFTPSLAADLPPAVPASSAAASPEAPTFPPPG